MSVLTVVEDCDVCIHCHVSTLRKILSTKIRRPEPGQAIGDIEWSLASEYDFSPFAVHDHHYRLFLKVFSFYTRVHRGSDACQISHTLERNAIFTRAKWKFCRIVLV